MNKKCKHSGPKGMCPYDAIDSSVFCRKHTNEKDRIMSYELNNPEIRAAFQKQHSSEQLRSLSQEVALLRAMLQRRLNMVKSEAEEIDVWNQLTPAFNTIDKLVNSLQKLELETSIVLSKETATKLAQDIVAIITDELRDVEDRDTIVDRIAVRIAQTIVEARNARE